MSTSRRVVITTFGSLGDLHPYIAIALGLKARGHEAIVATGACYRRKIEALGLGFRAVRPDCVWVADPAFIRRISHPRWGLIRIARFVLAWLREAFEDTSAAASGADLLVGNMGLCATRLVAEKTGVPWASVMHSPILFYSAYDPPLLPGFPELSKALRFLGPAFWGPLGRVLKWATRGMGGPVNCLREEIGLPAIRGENVLTEGHSSVLHLACFSKWLVDKQPDWPASTLVTGFPWHDADGGGGAGSKLPPALASFLDEPGASPPIVFTLGSVVAADAGRFFEHSAAAACLLRRRAVLILKDPRNRPAVLAPGVVAFEYAPFSLLFPRAAAIVHHGGIGTTGLAMRAGRPMLVMPCAWDQPDNAERVRRLGIARTISRRPYTPARVAAELRRLLDEPAYARRATHIGACVQKEDGARTACDALERLL